MEKKRERGGEQLTATDAEMELALPIIFMMPEYPGFDGSDSFTKSSFGRILMASRCEPERAKLIVERVIQDGHLIGTRRMYKGEKIYRINIPTTQTPVA